MNRREAIAAMAAAAITLPSGASEVEVKNRIIFRQPVLRIGLPNKNGRVYSQQVADIMLATSHEHGYVYGHLGCASSAMVQFSRVSHRSKLYQEENTIYADVELLNTPCGKTLRNLIGLGQHFDFRTSGVGNGQVDENGIFHVSSDSYKLISVDAVRNGS